MSDLSYPQASQEVKVVGQDATGLNSNYVGADANGNMLVKNYSVGPVTPGAVAPGSSLIGGQFNTVLPTLTNTQQSSIQLDSSGRIIISSVNQGNTGTNAQAWWVQLGDTVNGPVAVKPASAAAIVADKALVVSISPNAAITYSAIITSLAIASAATDIFTITGSASKKIKVRYVSISATATSTTVQDFQLVKRSATNTGGTSSTPAAVPHDSGDAAASATVRAYTANPTSLGAIVGSGIRTNRVIIGQTGGGSGVSSDQVIIWNSSLPFVKPLTLVSASEVLAINFNGGTSTGATVDRKSVV